MAFLISDGGPRSHLAPRDTFWAAPGEAWRDPGGSNNSLQFYTFDTSAALAHDSSGVETHQCTKHLIKLTSTLRLAHACHKGPGQLGSARPTKRAQTAAGAQKCPSDTGSLKRIEGFWAGIQNGILEVCGPGAAWRDPGGALIHYSSTPFTYVQL